MKESRCRTRRDGIQTVPIGLGNERHGDGDGDGDSDGDRHNRLPH